MLLLDRNNILNLQCIYFVDEDIFQTRGHCNLSNLLCTHSSKIRDNFTKTITTLYVCMVAVRFTCSHNLCQQVRLDAAEQALGWQKVVATCMEELLHVLAWEALLPQDRKPSASLFYDRKEHSMKTQNKSTPPLELQQ